MPIAETDTVSNLLARARDGDQDALERLFEAEIRWHVLVDGRYQLLTPDADGLWRSRIFPGLWLDGNALLAGNLQQVLTRLHEGLRSPEHERFLTELRGRRQP